MLAFKKCIQLLLFKLNKQLKTLENILNEILNWLNCHLKRYKMQVSYNSNTYVFKNRYLLIFKNI